MNIQKFIAAKKKKFMEHQGRVMINRLEQLDRIKAEKQEAERNEFVRQELKREKEELRNLRLQKFKDVGFKIQRGLKNMQERANENENVPEGVFRK